ncbi:DCC1-like thiol-disulfide oxidoreductase family protein (plasmid) [Agrobacterium leguminum]|uniref:thiol-disulfide oxidoreductase DCC family protein n=1 Tax=Agrobacterium leguminum TaxID=2792015 RepID=UPI0030CEEE8E
MDVLALVRAAPHLSSGLIASTRRNIGMSMKGRNDLTIVFDTDCVLCSSWVRFILRFERDRSARFISAWSSEGAALVEQHGLEVSVLDQTYLVIAGGRCLTRSDAGLAIARRLSMPWRLLILFAIIPRPVRDLVYNLVARNRYRWFGRRAACFLPPADQRHRFINGSRFAESALKK